MLNCMDKGMASSFVVPLSARISIRPSETTIASSGAASNRLCAGLHRQHECRGVKLPRVLMEAPVIIHCQAAIPCDEVDIVIRYC
jgi:hypothetical protein